MPSEAARNFDLDRLYAIRYLPPEVFTPGHTATGEQVLVGLLDTHLLVAIIFSSEGRYLRYQFHPILGVPDPNAVETVIRQRRKFTDRALEIFVQQLGMTPGDIRVRHFAFPDWDIGIAEWYLVDFPDYERSVLTGEPLEDERLVRWQNDRRWVMHWGNEFEMSDDGEVLSS